MEHFHVPLFACPVCDKPLNCHAATHGTRAPQMGDFTLCAHCGLLFTFGLLGELQAATDAVLASITPEERAYIAQARAQMQAHLEGY